MKIKITQKGVFVPKKDGKKGDMEELEVGHEMTVEGDEIPSPLVGKCVSLEEAPKDGTVVNNKKPSEGK